jgi:DNA-damage-inducible protein D
MEDNRIVLFEEKRVRRIWHNDDWYFVVNDVIEILTDTTNVKQYWQKLNRRDPELKGGVQIVRLLFETEGGKQLTNCANTEGVLRLVQSITSPKAEPFKRWLAQVGYERIKEIEDPELGFDRLKEIYRAKGYPDEWIETRLKSIEIRKGLTDEWKDRGVKEGQEYAILTAEIAKATFGLSPTEHKVFKKLERENLRDHMTNLELIFTMLGEEATRQIAVSDDAVNFEENHDAAVRGGNIAGKARRNLEKETGKAVVSPTNFLNQDGVNPPNDENNILTKG